MFSLFPLTPTTEGAARYRNSSVAGGVSGISIESVVSAEDCGAALDSSRPEAFSLIAVLLEEVVVPIFALIVSQISSRSTGRCLQAFLFSPPLRNS